MSVAAAAMAETAAAVRRLVATAERVVIFSPKTVNLMA
jgi:hypothetical protein